MEESDSDLSEEELTDSEEFVSLPCDKPDWPELSALLELLAASTSPATVCSVLREISKQFGRHSWQGDADTFQYFLCSECGNEERTLICSRIVPVIAELALALPACRPYLGVARCPPRRPAAPRAFTPEFVASLLAHSFLSSSGVLGLDLQVERLPPRHPDTHWKLRCFLQYFHQVSVGDSSPASVIVARQVLPARQVQEPGAAPLLPFLLDCESEATGRGRVLLTTWNKDSPLAAASPLYSQFCLQPLAWLLPLLHCAPPRPGEAVQVGGAGPDLLSLVAEPRLPRSRPALLSAVSTVQAGLRAADPPPSLSLLRPPSVAAVTSPALSEDSWAGSGSGLSSRQSSSDEDESEQSGSPARTTVRPARNRPVKKKESFNERLRAALERGNTPDESDCDVGPQVSAALPALPARLLVGPDPAEESEEFYTATDEEHSATPARRAARPRPGPLIRRTLLQDKSFDLSTSSAPPASPPSRPASSELFSDSESVSSAGLGMPQLEDDCMEDLADRLTGCIALSEDGLQWRDEELRRVAHQLGTRSLSESFLPLIGDLDLLAAGPVGRVECGVRAAHSCHRLPGQLVVRQPAPPLPLPDTVATHLPVGRGRGAQLWPWLVWVAASLLPGLTRVTCSPGLHPHLQTAVTAVTESNLTAANLIDLLAEFVIDDCEDLCNFITNKISQR